MDRLFRFAVGVLLAPLFGAFVWEAVSFLASNVKFYKGSWVTWGLASCFLIYLILSQRKIRFIEVLEHEVIHAAVAILLFGRDITELKANPETGGVTAIELGGNAIIRLAPYCLPILTIPLVAIRFFVSSSVTGAILDFLIGFTLAFHFFALRWEFNSRQTDFKRTGLLFSFGVVCLMNSILVVIITCMVSGNYSYIRDYFDNSFARAQEFYRIIDGAWRKLSCSAMPPSLHKNLLPTLSSPSG